MNKKKIGPMEKDSQLIVAKGGRNIFFTDVDLVRCQYSYIQLLTHTPVSFFVLRNSLGYQNKQKIWKIKWRLDKKNNIVME